MPIDASIYGQIKPFQAPSPLEAAQGAMTLSQMGIQRQQQQYQMAQLQATRQAYAQNTDQAGNVDVPGAAATLSRMGFAQQGMELRQQAAAQDKAQAEADIARTQAIHQAVSVTHPALGYLLNLPDDQASAAYPGVLRQLADQGVPMHNFAPQWNRGLMQQSYDIGSQMKEGLENQAAQAGIAKTNAETGKIYSETGDLMNKRVQNLQDDLDPNKARGGNLAKSQSVINAADRLNAMFTQFPDYNIPKAQQAELTAAFGAMLNGGSAPLQSQLEELVPSSMRGNASAIASWVTNQPLGQNQQKYMQLLHESVGREQQVAQTQVRQAQVQRLGGHELVKNQNPAAYWSVLHNYGIEPGDIQNGKYSPASEQAPLAGPAPGSAPARGGQSPGGQASSSPGAALIPNANAGQARDPQIAKWAKDHALPYDQALSIIQKRRGNGGK